MFVCTRLRHVAAALRSTKLSHSVKFTTTASEKQSGPDGGFQYGTHSIDPFSYTSGRWLRNDVQERQARYVKFDFDALCSKVLSVCRGARSIVEYEKKEGSYNRAFILQLNTGQKVVARIPFSIAGPQKLRTHSEVASIAYLRQHSSIPVPEILDWSGDASNPTGTEYIIMEYARGVQLHDRWPSMDCVEHMRCVKGLSAMVAELAKIKFPAYGSLYFADAPFDPQKKIGFTEGFVIGPHVGAPVWPCESDELLASHDSLSSRGPWLSVEEYCSDLITAALVRPPRGVTPPALPFQGSAEEQARLLSITGKVIGEVIKHPTIQDISTPMLMHPDFHKRNIFVSEDDPTKVTAVIDWQSLSIDPTFSFANFVPDFLLGALGTEYLPDDQRLASMPETERKKIEIDKSFCQQTWSVMIQGYAPLYHKARETDDRILRVIQCYETLFSVSLQKDLIDLSQHWGELKLLGSCPYQPSESELEEHRKRYEDFATYQQLRITLMQLTYSSADSWIPPPDDWEDVQKALKQLYRDWMSTAAGPGVEDGLTEEKAHALWPFDME